MIANSKLTFIYFNDIFIRIYFKAYPLKYLYFLIKTYQIKFLL